MVPEVIELEAPHIGVWGRRLISQEGVEEGDDTIWSAGREGMSRLVGTNNSAIPEDPW